MQILSVPFSPQDHGVLWFMYSLIGLYLVAPVISPWLKENKRYEIKIVLMLWVVTLFFPVLRNHLIIREDLAGTLYYFSGYLGYFLLGYYFRTYKPKISFYFWTLPLLISVIAPIIEYKYRFGIDKDAFWYLGVFIACLVAFIFYYVAIKFKVRINNFCIKKCKVAAMIKFFSSITFGIYLIHLAVMRFFLWEMSWFAGITNCYIQTAISFCITMFISILLVALLKKIPVSKYIIAS